MMHDFNNEVIKDSGVSLFLFLRPLALGEDQWRDGRGKVLRVDSPALVKPLEDAILENILIETSWETLSQNHLTVSIFLTHRYCDRINVYGFKPKGFGIICYAAIDN